MVYLGFPLEFSVQRLWTYIQKLWTYIPRLWTYIQRLGIVNFKWRGKLIYSICKFDFYLHYERSGFSTKSLSVFSCHKRHYPSNMLRFNGLFSDILVILVTYLTCFHEKVRRYTQYLISLVKKITSNKTRHIMHLCIVAIA